MSLGIRLKRNDIRESVDGRMKNKGIAAAKRCREKCEMEHADVEVIARAEELGRLSNESVKGRKLRPNIKRDERRFDREKGNDSRVCRLRIRRSDVPEDSRKERKPLIRGRKEWSNDANFAKKGKAYDSRSLTRKPIKTIRKVIDGDVCDFEQNGRGFYRRKDKFLKTEAPAGNIKLKRRKLDGAFTENGQFRGAKQDGLEKHATSNDGESQISEQKHFRRPNRVLDKTGKKIRVQTKPAENGSTENSASKKTRRRVMKLDPYDISNKRMVDSVPNNDIAVEKETVVSMNAQFRAIQPSDEILSFVEDNLLGRRRLIELKNAGYNVKLSAPLDNLPFSTALEREKIEENVFRNKLKFFAAAKTSSSFPPPTLPEIAFAGSTIVLVHLGRSNVGKSSLLNALTRQWGVVRTSDKPGLTQTINFFKLASKLCLVDLPGYGFAYAKEEVKETWEELVKEFVSTRVGLQRVCLLIDTKWGMKARDFELIELMERSKTPYQVVLTKTDIVFPIDVARRAMQIQEKLKSNKSIIDPVIMVSSKSGAGIRNLRSVLAKIARFVKP